MVLGTSVNFSVRTGSCDSDELLYRRHLSCGTSEMPCSVTTTIFIKEPSNTYEAEQSKAESTGQTAIPTILSTPP